MSKILITESLHPSGVNLLKCAGHQVVCYERITPEELRQEIIDTDAIFVRVVDLPIEILRLGKQLKIISNHGVGVDNIPLDYCREAGIAVTIVRKANSLSVAEHALALMLAISKKIIPTANSYRLIGYRAKNTEPGFELTGKTVGVVGLGQIGSHLARILTSAFQVKVLAYDPYLKEVPAGVELTSDLDRMFREADFVSLHAGLTNDTYHMVNWERLNMMKSSAILINCARGPLVDEAALIRALENGIISGAGLDVTEVEPAQQDNPLFSMENVILTPHFATATYEAMTQLSLQGAQNILDVLNGKRPEGQII